MKVQIKITGQIMGNFALLSKLQICSEKVHKLRFSTFLLDFNSKKEARMALHNAKEKFKEESQNCDLFYDTLLYDASKAEIIKP